MVPGLIKEQFWQLREHIGAFSIAAGDDVIPWELLYPLAAGHDEGFLVEQFPVMRRVYGQQRSRSLGVTGARYVLPARSPANAQAEIATIRQVLGDSEPTETISDLNALLGFIESGNCGSLHFACHNAFMSEAGGSAITMGGGSFVPMLLNKAVTRRALADRNPLIFVNACRSAGAVPEYTRMTGWAQQFMAAGAGAFVGTMWAVGSTAAQIFAEAFYTALASGNSLGEASRLARAEAGRDHDDPAWLAYSVYGDPAAQAITTAAR
jgi:CHAT domain-containing protein